MERTVGYIVGAVVALLLLATVIVLFGSAIAGMLAVLFAFPLALPLTTSAVAVAVIWGYFVNRRKQSQKQDHP